MQYAIANLQKVYTLVQCHFHHGSEHTVAGKQYAFETHCVHSMDSTDTSQRYGVFGVFYDVGSTSTFLQQFEDELPSHVDSVSERRLSEVSFNLYGEPMDAVSKRRLASTPVVSSYVGPVDFSLLHSGIDLTKFYSYDGSFTTPPCTEAVDFYIYMQPQQLTLQQLTKFQNAMGWNTAGGNFRPPQAVNERTIFGCTELPQEVEDVPWYPYDADNWAANVGVASHPVCKGGSEQSPIDFQSCSMPSQRAAIGVSWANQPVDLVNNGHTVQLTAKGAEPGKMVAGGKTYTLVQCHFHWGSEHTVGGVQYPFEAHCVHTMDSNDVASHYGVFGTFYTRGTSTNAFLGNFVAELPHAARRLRSSPSDVSFDLFGNPVAGAKRKLAGGVATSDWHGPLDFKGLYGSNARTNYWDYAGSFTTPPCTEAVDFYIMMDPQVMSSAQLRAFQAAIGWETSGGNFRPPQRLGSRVVAGCDRLDSTLSMVEDAVDNSLPSNMKSIIADEVHSSMKAVLDAEQGQHTGMLVGATVLGAFTLGSVGVMGGVLVMLFKSASARTLV
jgi:carbonic anhydrase